MIKRLVRYLVFVLIVAGMAYGGYRFMPATSKTTPTEKAEKKEHRDSDGVELSDAKVEAAGIELAKASTGVLRDSLLLNGIVQPNQESLVQVTPRFPGIVRDVRKRIGDVVQKGDVLAIVESNQSLTPYELKAALAGTVIDRQTTLGEYVSEQKPAFVIADLSAVWVDFSVYRRDLKRVSIGDEVLIEISDAGIGMELEEAAHCFDKFWQAESTDLRRYGGTGIGLYIVRSLVEAMAGRIGVTSERGVGSTFTIALRQARKPTAEAAAPGVGESTSIREFMRQLGVPERSAP